ncbi:MAG: SpoIIE family protein phosphatase, partial [Acidobacteria bacterium]|nr:SpoIIE family protein phosphatase [Acidobacteriota bacterium]
MQASRGVTFIDFSVIPTVGGAGAGPAGADPVPAAAAFEALRFPFGAPPPDGAPTLDLPSVARVDLLDWSTGRRGRGAVGFRVHPTVFYREVVEGGEYALGGFVWGLLWLGVMCLTIEAAAMVMGFALAGSITGAVHELFTGTERVRQGDLTHRIRVGTEDQLGELAESFNTMTGSIADLMAEAAEKRRLEEELRIARDIQMSLLPEGPASVPGLTVTAACRPAREVGGDYYDFIRLDEHRLGVLVADVSGKGTSAAFYMAELKGVVLSLSRFHQSPRELLIEVNRILSATLDGRTFITMTYAVLDLAARRLTYARAGHTPLVHVPFAPEGPRTPRVLAPDGLVVGLQIDGVEEKFIELLEESSFSLETGDLVALFTDGVTEAMNEESDLFGEERLSRLLTEQIHLSSDDLMQRVLGDVEAFAGTAEQHDDMTIVLLRVGDAPSLPPPASRP